MGKVHQFAVLLLSILSISLTASAQTLAPVLPEQGPPHLQTSTVLVGGRHVYTIHRGDTLLRLSQRFLIPPGTIAAQNHWRVKRALYTGRRFRLANWHIVPAGFDNGLLVNVPEQMLFHLRNGAVTQYFPVGAGQPGWETVPGDYRVVRRVEHPIWRIPASIRQDLRAHHLAAPLYVPAGPSNPLGQYMLALNKWHLAIHGTDEPRGIYRFPSHGCIRLFPRDIKRLYPTVPVGTAVRVAYQPVLLAQLPDGEVYLEAHPDIYQLGADGHGADAMALVSDWARRHNAETELDWLRVRSVLDHQDGVAHLVSRAPLASPLLTKGDQPLPKSRPLPAASPKARQSHPRPVIIQASA